MPRIRRQPNQNRHNRLYKNVFVVLTLLNALAASPVVAVEGGTPAPPSASGTTAGGASLASFAPAPGTTLPSLAATTGTLASLAKAATAAVAAGCTLPPSQTPRSPPSCP